MIPRILRAALVLAVLALLAGPSAAAPITYNHTGGTAMIDITVGGSTFSFGTSLAGTFVTYDSATSEITDFLVNTDDQDIALPGAFPIYEELDLAISAFPDAGSYSSGPGVGSDVDLLNVDLNLAGLLDNISGLPFPDLPFDFTADLDGPLGVDVSIVGSQGTFTFEEMHWLHAGVDVLINVTFIGVPEPSTLGLMGLATAGLLAAGVRRRS